MDKIMLKVDNLSKQYVLGQIGGTTLKDELQRVHARIKNQEDPTRKIGSKDYNKGEHFDALKGISFEVKQAERVGIIGHNGAGKSTLLKLISRITAPSSGQIGLNGRVASMLEVGTGFHPELTGRENIYMNGAILGMTRKEIDLKIDDIIDFSECGQFIDTPVKRYSSGMYVKLAFSVAAHLNSEIMIMDEVLAVGDMAFQKKCLDKMNDVSKTEGRTILYVSHNMSTIRQLCSRCIVLNKGEIVFDGDVEDAINIYLTEHYTTSNCVDLLDWERTFEFKNPNVMLKKLEILSDEALYEVGGTISGRLAIVCIGNHQDVRLEFGIHSRGVYVTRFMNNENLLNLKDGINLIEFKIDLTGLAPSKYEMDIDLKAASDYGTRDFLDGLKQVYHFEIIPTKGFFKNGVWNTTWNGWYISNPIEIRELTAED